MNDCLFCKISAGELGTEFVYEDDKLVVFNDINPKADLHLLITPKQHIVSLNDIDNSHNELVMHIIKTMQYIASKRKIKGYRTVINIGREGGQEIDHLHFHFLHGNLPTFGKG